jgi:hypothetical protein
MGNGITLNDDNPEISDLGREIGRGIPRTSTELYIEDSESDRKDHERKSALIYGSLYDKEE